MKPKKKDSANNPKRPLRITLAKPDSEMFSRGWRILSRRLSAPSSPDGKKALLMGVTYLEPAEAKPATPPDTKAGQTVRDEADVVAANPRSESSPKKESDESEGDTQPRIRDQKD